LKGEWESKERTKIIASLLNVLIHWDCNGTVLAPAQSILVTVNLEVAADGDFIDFLVKNNVTAFGFNMTVYASGV
jgi:hypothetical protein